jgi:hypothetical protein
VWARLFPEVGTWSHLSCTRDYGTLSVASLSCNGLLEISNKLVPCRESRRYCSINSLPASQAEVLDVEIFSSSRGSRIVNMEKSSIVYSSLVRALNLQILKVKQGSTPRIGRSNLLRFSLLLSQTHIVVHRVFLVLLPITVDYLDRWAPSSSVSRPYVAMTSLYPRFPQLYSRRRDRVSWPCWAPCCIHQIIDWVNWPLQPHSGYKTEPFTRNRQGETPFPSEVGITTVLVLLLASLAFCHWSIQAVTHDSVFGRVRVVSLDIVRDVPLYRRRIMSAISCLCAHSSSASSWTAMR